MFANSGSVLSVLSHTSFPLNALVHQKAFMDKCSVRAATLLLFSWWLSACLETELSPLSFLGPPDSLRSPSQAPRQARSVPVALCMALLPFHPPLQLMTTLQPEGQLHSDDLKSYQTQHPPDFTYTESDHITDFSNSHLSKISGLSLLLHLMIQTFPNLNSLLWLASTPPPPGPPTSPTAGEPGSSFCSCSSAF